MTEKELTLSIIDSLKSQEDSPVAFYSIHDNIIKITTMKGYFFIITIKQENKPTF